MQSLRDFRSGAGVLGVVLAGAALFALPSPGSAQYFGRNKVQYEDFSFSVLPTQHYDFYYYPVEAKAVEDMARMGSAGTSGTPAPSSTSSRAKKPVILYADHPDFQQTNTLSGSIGEGTGGVTESLKNRVIMPLTGSYADNDHVLGHELVHAFQYNIAQSSRGGGMQGLNSLPLWLIEGMAEYLSVGRDDPLTAMWIRDAIRRDELPDHQGDDQGVRASSPTASARRCGPTSGGRTGTTRSSRSTGAPCASASSRPSSRSWACRRTRSPREWKAKVAQNYLPLMEGRTPPTELGTVLMSPANGWGPMNVAPSISPDGRFVAVLSQKDLFSVDLFLADAQTGKQIRKLVSANSDPHIEALRFIDSSGTWSPDGRYFAFIVTADGDNQIVIVDADSGDEFRRISMGEKVGAVNNPAWSPDGRTMAFSGMVGGISDLYLYDLESGDVTQLTDDKNADLQPTWSPDGRPSPSRRTGAPRPTSTG